MEALESRVVMYAAGSGLDIAVGQAIALAGSDQVWNLSGQINPSTDPSISIKPTRAESFTIDQALLDQVLSSAPLEFTAEAATAPLAISLPRPDGLFERFAIVDAPIADPDLAARFPDIRTYRGQGIDDPTATVRFDVTPLGFHAQVLSADGTFYIDPARHLDTSEYISYFRTDLTSPQSFDESLDGHPSRCLCGLCTGAAAESFVATASPKPAGSPKGPDGAPFIGPLPGDDLAGRSSGAQLRTYRLAVATSGEYTAVFGGTVTAGLSAVITTMNRVVGIYETELTIRMVLVANQSSIIYTNAATDPYTNTNPSLLLSQNQSNLDAVIGTANYDIGHVFTTGGGGLAGLGVVGNPLRKAQGETGLGNPVGDAFAVDYVAHEMGHQFGANHTFNTPNSGTNRNGPTAYEPGSGSTIMAYAGITGATGDLQPNSDPVFHWKSFDEIIAYVDNVIPSVGTRTNTGNSVPTVSAGPNYVIPAQTPFVLTAVGSDADGDALTYNWEESDLGPANNPGNADNGSSPLFRSFVPSTSPSRTFPRLSNLVNNTTVFGERLPTTNRNLKFRITVRDGRGGVNDGGGGSLGVDTTLQVVNTGAAFAVTSPNTALTWGGGSTQTVTWDVAGTTGNGINAANVRILLSTDGGLTYPTVLVASTPNDGSDSVATPNINTTTARIRVEAVGNIFFDISNANFAITAAISPAVVGLDSTIANGAYGIGASIPISVGFSAPVFVTGTPTLALNSGGSAVYASGSGSSTLIFTYIVGVGQAIPDLDASSTSALGLAGGTILGTGGLPAALAVPTPGGAASLGANKDIVIDGIAPTVVQYRVLYGSQSSNLIGSTRVNLPWQVTGIQAVFSESINAGSLGSLGGLTATSFAGLGTNTLTWALSPLTSGIFSSSLLASGAGALRDAVGNALGVGVDFTQNFRVLYGDVNDDGFVNSSDMVLAYASTALPYNPFADLNGDGVVDTTDVLIARSRIGQSL